MPHTWYEYLILFGVGAVTGTLNVLAGGGSFITLPVMIFLGLPPTVANGTNRVAILVQNLGAVWGFSRHGLVDRRWLVAGALPALVGAVLGTLAAVVMGEQAFRRVLAVIMVVMSLWALWDPLRGRQVGHSLRNGGRLWRVGLAAAFFLVGLYAGFVQAGVGFLILAVAAFGGLNLVIGNALKVFVLLAVTPISLFIFAVSGKVEWDTGAALAAGSLLGALLGVHLTIRKGHQWIKRLVTVVIIVFAVRLWITG